MPSMFRILDIRLELESPTGSAPQNVTGTFLYPVMLYSTREKLGYKEEL